MPGIRRAVAVLLCSLAACTAPQWYRPRTSVTGESPAGYPAGEYELETAGRRIGEIRIWSNGGWREEGGPVVSIGVEVENVSGAPVVLGGDLELGDLVAGTVRIGRVVLEPPAAGLEVPPGQLRGVEVAFELDPAVDPWSIEAFVLRWTIEVGGQRAIEGATPFRPDVRSRYTSYVYGPIWHSDGS